MWSRGAKCCSVAAVWCWATITAAAFLGCNTMRPRCVARTRPSSMCSQGRLFGSEDRAPSSASPLAMALRTASRAWRWAGSQVSRSRARN